MPPLQSRLCCSGDVRAAPARHDDSTALDEQIDGLATAATDAAMEAQSSLRKMGNALDSRRVRIRRRPVEKRTVVIDSANGGETLRRQQAAGVLASLDFARWTPSPPEEFESLTSGTASPVSMTLSQDKTICTAKSSSGRLDIASVSFWPDKQMAKFEVTVDASEGIYLLDELGITTKEKTTLVTLHFRIPETAADTRRLVAESPPHEEVP